MKSHKYFAMDKAIETLRGLPIGVQYRCESFVAKRFLLENTAITSGGFVFYFYIRSLGMGVYSIQKAPINERETKMIK